MSVPHEMPNQLSPRLADPLLRPFISYKIRKLDQRGKIKKYNRKIEIEEHKLYDQELLE